MRRFLTALGATVLVCGGLGLLGLLIVLAETDRVWAVYPLAGVALAGVFALCWFCTDD